jgi:hypothetical protein
VIVRIKAIKTACSGLVGRIEFEPIGFGIPDRRAQRGSQFVAQGEDPNREAILFAGSALHFMH